MKTLTKAAILLGLNSLLIGSVMVKQANSCIIWFRSPAGEISKKGVRSAKCAKPKPKETKADQPKHETYFFRVFNDNPEYNLVIRHENTYHVIPARSFKTLTSTIGNQVLIYADRRKDLPGFNQIVYQFDAKEYDIRLTYDRNGYIRHGLVHD